MISNALLAAALHAWAFVREYSPWSWLLVMTLCTVAGWSWWLSRSAEHQAMTQACWLDITPPAQPPGEGVEALPRALAGLLAALPTQPHAPRIPPRLAVEMVTDGHTARMGLWFAGGVDTAQVAAAITHALPGARVSPTDTSTWTFTSQRAGGRELRPSAGPWTVLLAPARRGVSSSPEDTSHESLRSVFTALAESPHPAALQLVLTPAPVNRRFPAHHGVSAFDSGRSWAQSAAVLVAHGAGKVLLWALYTMIGLLREAMFSARPSHRSGAPSRREGNVASLGYPLGIGGLSDARPAADSSRNGPVAGRAVDPVMAAENRERMVKQGTRPLLHATLRVAALAASPTTGRRCGARLAGQVAIGYALALPRAQIRPYRTRRFERALRARRPGRGFYTTLAELGALWHLPAEPARYRLPDPAARNRPARPDVPRLPTPHN